jgi:protein-tyrosine phosphatase
MSKSNIINEIYIGNYTTALYESNEFDFVINCTTELQIPKFKKDDNFFRVPVVDIDIDNDLMLKYLPEVTEIIHKNIDKRILVHCQQGSSRSATVVCAYLIRYRNFSLKLAIDYIKSKRPSTFHTIVFKKALEEFSIL